MFNKITDYIKRNPRRSLVTAIYTLAFIVVLPFLGLGWLELLITYAVITVVLIIVFYSSLLAIIGNYLYITGDMERGVRILKKALDRKTISPVAHLNYSIHLVRSGNGREAIEYLQRGLALKPTLMTEKNIMLTLGSSYWTIGEIDKAIEILEGMRSRYEYVNAHVLTTLGYMYFVKQEYEKAKEITYLAIDDTPNSGSAWDNMGQINYALNQRDEAKSAFLKAIEYKDDLPDSHYYLALLAYEDGDIDLARERIQKAESCTLSALNTVNREQIEKLKAQISSQV